jgi:hypothetical protein
MMASRCPWLVAGLMTLTSIGCSKAPEGPKTVPAKGKVTFKSLPVEGATVSFLGDGKTAPAIAITDAGGEFILTTSRSGDGAVPGSHRVTVTKIINPPGASKAKSGMMSMEDAAKAAAEPPAKPLYMLPEHYASAETSGLTFTVKEGDKNDFLIELTD